MRVADWRVAPHRAGQSFSEGRMRETSTVTVREQPAADVLSVAGALHVHSELVTIETDRRVELIDMTDRVMSLVRRVPVKEGTINLFATHTTCAVLLNEFQMALVADITKFLDDVVSRDAEWMHNNPVHSDCDRM